MFSSVNFIFPLTIIFLRFIPVACKDVFSFLVVGGKDSSFYGMNSPPSVSEIELEVWIGYRIK